MAAVEHCFVEHRFRVMASAAQLVLVDPPPGAEAAAVDRLRQLERRWSRFLPESDVSRLARAGGSPLSVSRDTCLLVETMQQAHLLTVGGYDPTMLREIVEAGYGASVDGSGRRSVTIDLPHPTATIAAALVDRRSATVQLPEGMALDPGGIGKGLAADLVAGELVRRGAAGALVSIGGDLSAVGRGPAPTGWPVIVDDPLSPGRDAVALATTAGGVATTSTRSRSWQQGGRRRHHVLDPRTGCPADTDLAAVTVFAPSGWEAEVHATAAVLRGGAGAVRYLDDHGLSGLAVTVAGAWTGTADLAAAIPRAVTAVGVAS